MKAKVIARVFNSEKTPLENKIPLDTPYSVHIDICSSCNFQCNFCFQSNRDAMRAKGYKFGSMSFSLFEKITDDLAGFNRRIRKVKIGLHGEPTLHPDLPRMIRHLKNRQVAGTVELFTNGSLLTPQLNSDLIGAGLDRINVSIEGVSAEQYKEITGVAVDIARFVENIKDLYKRRGNCRIYIKIVDSVLNREDKERFFSLYGDICDEIFIEHVVPQWGEINKFAVDAVGMYGQKVDKYKEVCPFPFMYLHFNFDGTVSPCTLDWGKQVMIGDAGKESALEIWQGNRLNGVQVKMLEKKRGEIGFCNKCLAPLVCCLENLDDHAERLLKKILRRDV